MYIQVLTFNDYVILSYCQPNRIYILHASHKITLITNRYYCILIHITSS